MNLFDANSIVGDLGLVGVLAIIFAETGLLIGLAFPGDSLLFIAGVAASGSGAAILGNASLNPVLLFLLSPFAAIFGSVVGYWFGERYGKKLFDRPDGRIFNQHKVAATQKWLTKYGIGKALVLARFVPFVRTLINPMCGIIGIPPKTFFLWNSVSAIIWADGIILAGYFLGESVKDSLDTYLLPITLLVLLITTLPVIFELFREWRTKKDWS